MSDASDHGLLQIPPASGHVDTFNCQEDGTNCTQSPPRPSEPLIWRATSAVPQSAAFSLTPSRPKSVCQKKWNRTWNLETIASLTSVLSLIAPIVLLASQDGKPLSTWVLPISLNTAASILAVAIKAPFAFVVGAALSQTKWFWFFKRQGPLSSFIAVEEAGRGPLGSLSLL
ncbi:hypothetical protein EDB81DRAFT_934136 [Dactylonectria macrodidyma]|uniref:Uncharacterized protein n=1 Tax=Dactylonectria macrodidyma TaxID=307937 RepID=A0A9P9EV84_9HYPO|nr:hypothetical protein EDB81DRAFT_934136 [Dactylonectria macrodidyma]